MLMRRLGFLAIAAFISIGTVIGARSWLHAQLAAREVPVTPPVPIAELNRMVLVASGDLPAGQFVRPDNLHWQAWPEASIAENYIVQGKGKLEDYVGAVVRSGLTNGEPIAEGRVVRPGDRGFMAAVLTPGNRAITVPVTPSSGLAGFVFPGDRVDVILTLTIQPEKDGQKEGIERRASETVLTDIRVLATDQRADDQKREVTIAKTATLEVTPKQAEVIAVASEMGKLSLSLRSLAQEGAQVAEANTHTWDNDAARLLRSLPRGAGAGRTVTVVRGSERKEVDFAGIAR
jgi:pilus assembly protein CpaB